jgi:chemotaxis protein MotB
MQRQVEMRGKKRWVLLGMAALVATGCAGDKDKYEKLLAERDGRISTLEQEVVRLEGELVAEEQRASKLNQEMETALAEYKANEQVWLEMKDAKTVITVSDAVLFPSGNADMLEVGKPIIDRIATVAKNHADRTILIEGHTDNRPIGEVLKTQYFSNWELSSARACSVLRYMYWQHKIEPSQLAAVGYGEYRPIADNATDEGRGRNRRVVIVIGEKTE